MGTKNGAFCEHFVSNFLNTVWTFFACFVCFQIATKIMIIFNQNRCCHAQIKSGNIWISNFLTQYSKKKLNKCSKMFKKCFLFCSKNVAFFVQKRVLFVSHKNHMFWTIFKRLHKAGLPFLIHLETLLLHRDCKK